MTAGTIGRPAIKLIKNACIFKKSMLGTHIRPGNSSSVGFDEITKKGGVGKSWYSYLADNEATTGSGLGSEKGWFFYASRMRSPLEQILGKGGVQLWQKVR
jgi:hypothetical protein